MLTCSRKEVIIRAILWTHTSRWNEHARICLMWVKHVCSLVCANFACGKLFFTLQGMEHPLAQQGKSGSAEAHPFQELQFMHLPLNHPI